MSMIETNAPRTITEPLISPSALNAGLDMHDLLMSCGAAKLTILGLNNLYAVRTEQMQQIVEKIKSHYKLED